MTAQSPPPPPLRLRHDAFLEMFKQEFRVRNIWMTGQLSYGKVNWLQAFGCSNVLRLLVDESVHWKIVIVWRILLACLGFGVWVWNLAEYPYPPWWPIYLTHWMLTVHLLYVVTLAISTVMAHLVYGIDSDVWKDAKNVPWYVKVAWLTNSFSLAGGLFVVIFYWLLLATSVSALFVFSHGGVWAFIMLDHILGLQPFVLVQVIWLVIFGLCYAFWTIIHFEAGLVDDPVDKDHYIYTISDWGHKPGTAAGLAFGGPLGIIPCFYFVIWLLNFVREQGIYSVDKVTTTTPDGGAGNPEENKA